MSRLAFLALAVALGGCAGAIGSIGAVLRENHDTGEYEVKSAPSGMPAAEAGIEEGDRLKMVDGVLIDGLSREAIQDLLRGEVGTSVELTIIRGGRVLRLDVERAPIRERVAPRGRPPAP